MNFQQIVVVDFEYEVSDGDLPNPLCLVAYVLDEHLHHTRTLRLWRGDFGSQPPFDVGSDTLFVAYSAWAEMTCFKVLGWKFPEHVFDLHTAYLAASNILAPYDPNQRRKKPRKRLSDACRAYGIDGWESIDKEVIAKDIGVGLWAKYGREQVLNYCEQDVLASARLLLRQLRGNEYFQPASVKHVLHWSNYSAKAVALIQMRDIPIDMPLWNLVQENKAAVIGELLRQFDPSHGDDNPIHSADGGWEYARFRNWLARSGINAWPHKESGQLDISGDAFRAMYHIPGIEGLHALRDSVGFIAKARLPIGRDGRNRPSLFPFGTTTGRNAHCRSPYNAHAGVRGFIVFPPNRIGLYLDWRSQEVAIAAQQSGDQALQQAYQSDVYHALALACGFTDDRDPKHWKEHNYDVRQHMKTLQLGINYGMGVPSLAKGLDRHPQIASYIIDQHQRTYPRSWQWRTEILQEALLTRRLESCFGWPLRISTSPNKRTLVNFPVQSAGAEMLRLAAWRLCEANIVPVMLIHDGILFELESREQSEQAKEIMRAAARDVCDGFEVGVDVDQTLIGGARYSDKRPVAQQMWRTIMGTLKQIGALPRSA